LQRYNIITTLLLLQQSDPFILQHDDRFSVRERNGFSGVCTGANNGGVRRVHDFHVHDTKRRSHNIEFDHDAFYMYDDDDRRQVDSAMCSITDITSRYLVPKENPNMCAKASLNSICCLNATSVRYADIHYHLHRIIVYFCVSSVSLVRNNRIAYLSSRQVTEKEPIFLSTPLPNHLPVLSPVVVWSCVVLPWLKNSNPDKLDGGVR